MRYTVTAQFYIEADNDQDATKQAKDFADDRRRKLDDWTTIMFVSETPFAELRIRQIYPQLNPTHNATL